MATQIKKERKLERNVSKANKVLIHELHDLMVLSKVIKRSRSTTSQSGKFLKLIQRRVSSNGRIENKFEHMVKVIESEILDLEKDNNKAYSAIRGWLDENGEYIHDLWNHMKSHGGISTNKDVEEFESEVDQIIAALSRYSLVLKNLDKSVINDIVKLEGHTLHDVKMGRAVNDNAGLGSGRLKRVVIVLDQENHIGYIKTGMDNHSILAGKYFRFPTRHSFWYGYEGGNLILHPAASEDKPRLNDWLEIFDNNPNFKNEIKKKLK